MITSRWRLIALAAFAAPALASCSFSFGGDTVDLDAVETAITEKFNDSLAPLGHSVSDVTCDDPGKGAKDGTTFNCIATASGTPFTFVATVAGKDVNFELSGRAIDMAKLGEILSTRLTERLGGVVVVNCGEGLKSHAVGSTFQCGVGDAAGNTRTLTYTVGATDADSSWKLD